MENGKQPINPAGYRNNYKCDGLTKREYFAGLAMQGFGEMAVYTNDWVAAMAVSRADALLAELEKTKSE